MEYKVESLNGDRVLLLPLQIGHLEGLYEAGRPEEIWQFMPRKSDTMEEMRRTIVYNLEQADRGTEYPFVIIDKEDGRIVGATRFLDIDPGNRSLEIGGTWLTPHLWRTRINTECKYLLLRHCFEHAGTIRVQLKTDSRNVRSQRAIERIGGVKEAVLRRHRVLADGYIRDSVYYSILDTEWPEVKIRLETMLRP